MSVGPRGPVWGLLILQACTTVQTPPPMIPERRQVELEALPPDAVTEPLPPGTPPGEWVEPQEAGACAGAPTPCPTRAGILVSEARATRDALYRIRYPELRVRYAADRRVWLTQRELYEDRLRAAQTALTAAQPDWFQRNALALGLVTGLIVAGGVAAAVLGAR